MAAILTNRTAGATLIACLCWVAVPTSGSAQGLPADANGIKIGNGRLHPYIQLDTRFVTNPGYMPPDGERPNDLVLVGRPGLDMVFPSNTLDLQFKGDLEWRQYLGLQNERTRDLSSLFATVGADATINKEGAVVIRLREKFLRTADPGNQTISTRLLRLSNDVGIGFDIRPGGGALIFSPDYTLFYERYDREQDFGTVDYGPEDLDNLRHIPKLRAAWKFLPKTAMFIEAEGQLTRYPSSNVNADANILLAYLGAAGSVTQKIALLLKAGYGNTFMSAAALGGDANFNSFVGQAEFNYLFSETMRFRAGALRTVQPTSLFKFFEMIRGYVGYNQAFGGQLQLDLNLSYNYLDYATAIHGTGGNRVDNNITADATLSYQLNEWLSISGSNRLDLRASNYTTQSGADVSYLNNDFFLRLSARY